MRSGKTQLIVMVVMILSGVMLQGQTEVWEGYTSCYQVRDIYLDGDVVWVATLGGLVSLNNGNGEKNVFNTANSGLNSNYITALNRDEQGNYWIGTDGYLVDVALGSNDCGGLHVWDGADGWEVYTMANSALPSNTIQDIEFDSQGNTWVACERGGLVRISAQGEWTIFHKDNSGLNSNLLTGIEIGPDDAIWITCFSYYDPADSSYHGGGIICYQDGTWTDYYNDISPFSNTMDFMDLTADEDGNIWFAGSYDGYFKYDGSGFTRYLPPADDDGIIGSVRTIRVAGNGDIYLGGTTGLCIFNGTQWSIFNSSNTVITESILDDIELDNGNIWLGSYYYGFYKFTDGQVSEIDISDPASGLPCVFIYDAECDQAGNVWIGSGDNLTNGGIGGLVLYNQDDWQLFDAEVLGYDWLVNDIFLADDAVYLATGNDVDMGGVIRYDGENWQRWDYTNGFPYVAANQVLVDQYGTIWATRYSVTGGLAYYQNGIWDYYNNQNSPLVTNQLYCLAEDRVNDRLWIGSKLGLFRYQISAGEWIHYHPGNTPQLPGAEILALFLDDNNILWIGHNGGLSSYDGQNWAGYNDLLPQVMGGYPSPVSDVCTDELGNLWIATYGGLVRSSETGHNVFNTANSVLPSNVILRISCDQNGHLWAATPATGLYCYSYQSSGSGDGEIPVIGGLQLGQNYPNPFNPATTISFQLPEGCTEAELTIHNIKGQLIKTFPINSSTHSSVGSLTQTQNSVIWDGRDDSGRAVSSGMYFYKLKTDNSSQTRKMILMK